MVLKKEENQKSEEKKVNQERKYVNLEGNF